MSAQHPYTLQAFARADARGLDIIWSESLGAWLKIRPIPGTEFRDATGLYPLTPQVRQTSTATIREELSAHDLVSVVVVSDPLDRLDANENDFDLNRSYKSHFLVNNRNGQPEISKHHQYEIRRAQRYCTTKPVRLADHLDEWCQLYDTLAERHQFGPSHRFSRQYFSALARMDQFEAIGAFIEGELVSCHIWAVSENAAYSHLAASSVTGYKRGAAYAVNAFALERYKMLDALLLGSTPDQSNGKNGLAAFKKGFANGEATNNLCGLIIQPDRYRALSKAENAAFSDTERFPSYRA